jgi:hypothetical protein
MPSFEKVPCSLMHDNTHSHLGSVCSILRASARGCKAPIRPGHAHVRRVGLPNLNMLCTLLTIHDNGVSDALYLLCYAVFQCDV